MIFFKVFYIIFKFFKKIKKFPITRGNPRFPFRAGIGKEKKSPLKNRDGYGEQFGIQGSGWERTLRPEVSRRPSLSSE